FESGAEPRIPAIGTAVENGQPFDVNGLLQKRQQRALPAGEPYRKWELILEEFLDLRAGRLLEQSRTRSQLCRSTRRRRRRCSCSRRRIRTTAAPAPAAAPPPPPPLPHTVAAPTPGADLRLPLPRAGDSVRHNIHR